MSAHSTWTAQVEACLAAYEGYTRDRYAAALAQFSAWYTAQYQTEPDAALLTAEELRTYRNALSAQGLQAATVNLRLAALRALLRAQGRTVKVKGVKQVAPAVEALDARELGRLLAAVEGPAWQDKRNVALLQVLARAGLRISEALALTVSDLTLNERSGLLLVRQGKGRKERRVPLGAEVRAALRAYLAVRPTPVNGAASAMLFLSRSWQPLAARDVQRLLTEAARRAGLEKKVTPHTLRHTFATRFLQSGGDLATLATLLGHSSVATTTRYLHPDAGRIQEMVEEL